MKSVKRVSNIDVAGASPTAALAVSWRVEAVRITNHASELHSNPKVTLPPY